MKVTFMPGIESISGTQKTVFGKRIVFTKRKSDEKGSGRVYLRRDEDYQRRTPVSKKELAARQLFATIAENVKNMTDDEKAQYEILYKKDKRKFNGKTYNTLRGFIVANLYDEYKKHARA